MRAYEIHAPGRALSFGTVEADAKRAAREANGIVKPVDIDTRKHELIDFLNGLSTAQYARDRTAEPQLASEPPADGSHILGPPTRDPPRLSPAFLGDLAGGAEFVPVAKAAEIDRLLQRCPACHHSSEAALSLQQGNEIETILAWAAEAPTWAVAQLATRLADLAEELTERTVQ